MLIKSFGNFLTISYIYLPDTTISPKDKAYMVCMQQHMFKNPDLEIGKVTYSELDIAKMLKIDVRTLRKYESSLQHKDTPIMTIVPTQKRDPQTGLLIEERIFDFAAYNNLLALKFQEVTDDISALKEDYKRLQRRVAELEKEKNTEEVKSIVV